MEQLSSLRYFVDTMCERHPQHKEEIKSLFVLCLDEIEEGGSVENEISLCIRDIEELIES